MRSPESESSVGRRVTASGALAVLFLLVHSPLAAQSDVRRTSSGRPDLSGTYDAATLTPLSRPAELGDKRYLTRAEAEAIRVERAAFAANAARPSDSERDAPPVGGAAWVGFEDDPEAGDALGAGQVGAYNWFWVDPGTEVSEIEGRFPTSIITDPANGRMPTFTPDGLEKTLVRVASFRERNTGTAWWVDDEVGPYDNMEQRPLEERCILSRSRSGPPILPMLYNNLKTIVQTEDHVVILAEQIHEARIVHLIGDDDRAESDLPSGAWMGRSIGHWVGDTLVVTTTGFREHLDLSPQRRVVERFSRLDAGKLLYQFTVDDPATWTEPWSGEYSWPPTDQRLFEYACHEGNYAMGNILRGARLLEQDAQTGGAVGAESQDGVGERHDDRAGELRTKDP